jgi:transcription initiation factor IIE alpha subunit
MIEAMKQALEALEQVKPLYDKHHAIAALRQAIAEAEKQERYFCERCGKRLSGGIHTCTPPVKACG